MDLTQIAVAGILINEFKDLDPKWPDEFDGRIAFFQDSWGFPHKITFSITEINSLFKQELTDENIAKNEYLVTYQPRVNMPHCVYMKRYTKSDGTLHCQNSWNGKDDYPRIPLNKVEKLYKVLFTCDIQGVGLQSPPPQESCHWECVIV